MKPNIIKDVAEILVWIAPIFGFMKAQGASTLGIGAIWILGTVMGSLAVLWFIFRRVFNTKQVL